MACAPGEIKEGPLFLKKNDGDNGLRANVGCGRFWECPTVWIEGGVDASTAQAGRAQTICVRVNAMANLPGGATAIENVNVQVWVSNLAIGIGPHAGLPSAGGTQGLSGFVASVPAGGSAVARCGPWTPVASDTVVSAGHVCIAVNCHGDAPDTGRPVPPLTYIAADGKTQRLCCDSHLAQRNVAVVAAPAGNLELMVEAMNPGTEETDELTVEVNPLQGELEMGVLERTLFATSPHVEVVNGVDPGGTDPPIDEVAPPFDPIVDETILKVLPASARLKLAGFEEAFEIHRAIGGVELELSNRMLGAGRWVSGNFEPGARLPIAVQAQFASSDELGAVQTIEVVQRTKGGLVTGGVTIHAILTE